MFHALTKGNGSTPVILYERVVCKNLDIELTSKVVVFRDV